MKFNLRFIISLTLIVLLAISFVLIVLEIMNFNSRIPYEFEKTPGNVKTKIEELKVGDSYKIVTLGTQPDTLVSNTQYHRYSSLLIHILAILSSAYIMYSG